MSLIWGPARSGSAVVLLSTWHGFSLRRPASCGPGGGPCPACCASPGTNRGRGLEVVGAITARGSAIWSLRSCVGQFQRHSTLCFFPLQETMPHLHPGGVQGLWRSRPGVNLVFTNPGVPRLLEKFAVVQLQRSRSRQCLRKGRLREAGSL